MLIFKQCIGAPSTTVFATSRAVVLMTLVVVTLGMTMSASVVNGQSSPDASPDIDANCTTITEIACNDDDDEYNLKAFCEAITISELDDDLNEDTWTIFVPNDGAFQALGRKNLDSLVFGNRTDNALTELLLFHVVGDNIALSSSELPCVAGSNLITMANNEDSRTQCERKDPPIPVSQKGKYNSETNPPKIIRADIQACNGIIHIIDKVMLDRELPFPIPTDGREGIDLTDFPADNIDSSSSSSSSSISVDETSSSNSIDEASTSSSIDETSSSSGISVDETISSSGISVDGTISSSASVDETSSSSSSDEASSSISSSSDENRDNEDETDDDEIIASSTYGPTDPGTTPGTTPGTVVNVDECQSIAEIACSTENLSIICELLKENALLDDLDGDNGLWTVFVPNNDAFNNAPPGIMTPDNIEDVLLGHTISNELIAFEDLVCTEKTEMTNGKYTRTVCATADGFYNVPKTYQNGGGNDDNQRPEIIDINIEACNGIIHIVSEVILPKE